VALKGAGIHNERTNLAHNLPLMTNPHNDSASAEHFNSSAYRLWGQTSRRYVRLLGGCPKKNPQAL